MTTSEDGVPRAQLGFLVAEFCTVGQCESRDILSDTTYTDAVGRDVQLVRLTIRISSRACKAANGGVGCQHGKFVGCLFLLGELFNQCLGHFIGYSSVLFELHREFRFALSC